MSDFINFFANINEETKKKDFEDMKKLAFKEIVDRYDLKIDSGKLEGTGKQIAVRGKEGDPNRVKLADKIFNDIRNSLKEFEPQMGHGGAGKSDSAPNIHFNNGLKFVFGPTEGTKAPGAAEYEKAIVDAWNYLNGVESKLKVNPETEETGMLLAKLLKDKEGLTESKATWLGGKSMKEVSEEWGKYSTRPDKTPKTDLMIGDRQISLKMGKTAQLASPKLINAEGQALFFTAAKEANLSEKILSSFKEYFELDEEGISKLGKNKKEYELRGNKYFKINHEKLTEKIRELVSNNSDFSFYIAREAITGEKKFSNTKNEEAIAEYLLVGSFDGDKLQFHEIDDNYVKYIARQLNIYVAWKSAGGSKYAVLRMTGPDAKFENKIPISRLLDEENGYVTLSLAELDSYANSLGITDNRLDEGIKDIFSWAKEKISKIAQKGIDKLFKLLKIEMEELDILGNNSVNFWE